MIVNGYSYSTVKRDVLDWWLRRLTWLSSFSYGMRQSGELINLEDEELISAAKAAGVRPMMVLAPIDEMGKFNPSPFISVLNDPQARTNLIDNIESTIKTKGLGGIDFDIEYLPGEYAAAYAEFVSDTRKRLSPLGLLTTVALAPRIRDDQEGILYEGHDYRLMGEAADYCLLMTYEWGYTNGDPLPVSPIANVREVLEYGITRIPHDKILMGLNNYGYDWPLPFVRGQSRASSLGNYEAAARAEYYGVPVEWDDKAMAPFFEYTDPYGTDHIVWFENERSWRARLDMVREFGLAGVSIWAVKNIFYGGI